MPMTCMVQRVSTQRSTLITLLLSGLHDKYVLFIMPNAICGTCRTTSLNMRPMITSNYPVESNLLFYFVKCWSMNEI